MKFRPIPFLVILLLVVLIAPLSYSIGYFELSITAQTIVLFLAASLLYPSESILLIVTYLILGALGLPVFSDYSSGYLKLAGVTAGFLWAFIPAAWFISYKLHSKDVPFVRALKYFFTAHVFVLLVGGLWMLTSVDFTRMIKMLVFTFLPIAAIKSILLAAINRAIIFVKKS